MSSKKYFDKVANHWDVMQETFFSESIREKAFDMVYLEEGKVAADIGAGTGYIAEGLIKRNIKVIAVDQSKAMLDVLKSKLSPSDKIDCRVGEAERLPIENDSVDYVFANMYLHHVEHPDRALKEMARILKAEGILVISDMDEHNFRFLKTEHNDRWMGFKREDIKRWLIKAGLKNVKIDCVGENCCTESVDSSESASIGVFVATGKK